ncbi:hypothetical protein DOY81_000148 [Sarcophaga bullata]|nr:hypothetical protein DOY81_000148 [Sarcophaga bullata]
MPRLISHYVNYYKDQQWYNNHTNSPIAVTVVTVVYQQQTAGPEFL